MTIVLSHKTNKIVPLFKDKNQGGIKKPIKKCYRTPAPTGDPSYDLMVKKFYNRTPQQIIESLKEFRKQN